MTGLGISKPPLLALKCKTPQGVNHIPYFSCGGSCTALWFEVQNPGSFSWTSHSLLLPHTSLCLFDALILSQLL